MISLPCVASDVITRRADLDQWVVGLNNTGIIAVDIEADSLYHFKEKVCLIQMASDRQTVVIDPLAVKNLTALKPVFRNTAITKVIHGSDYDVRSLHRDFKISINNLFDTQLAARFLGYIETGLEAVLKKELGISIDKKYQRKDWSKRPLPPEMIAYAASDVCHLIELANRLQEKLIEKRRLAWVQEECRLLSRVRVAEPGNGPLFVNFKGAGKLERRQLAVLENLLQLRVDIAREKDRPLYRVIGNRPLMTLALEAPTNRKALEKSGTLSVKQRDMYAGRVVKAIKAAMNMPAKKLPRYPRTKTPKVPGIVAERMRALRKWRDKRADQLQMDPALVGTKALLGAIAINRPQKKADLAKIDGFKRWQAKEFGKELIDLLKKTG
jgi:ribonuclease D